MQPGWVTSVAPAPIEVAPEAGGGADLTADNGIHLRPEHADVQPTSARAEVPEERSERGRVFVNPDGTYTLELSEERINYRDAAGDWQPIDLSLVDDSLGPYSVRVAANDRDVRFAQDDAEVALAELSAEGVSIGLRAIGFGAGTHRGDHITFGAGSSSGELGVRPTLSGFEFYVTLADKGRTPSYSFPSIRAGWTLGSGTMASRSPSSPRRSEGMSRDSVQTAELWG
jgi:hypothetical protein